MALYVADLYIDDSNDDTEDPTIQPGESASPDFGFIVGEGVSHKVVGTTYLDALKTTLDATEPSLLSLLDPGGPTATTLVWPAVNPSSLKDLDDMVFVDDQGAGDGRIHGKPWLSGKKYWDENDELVTEDSDDYWWKQVFFSTDITQYYWDGYSWIGPYVVTPDINDNSEDRHPVDDSEETLLSNALIAENNGYVITWTTVDKLAVTWPIAVPATGWNRLSRVGVVVGSPADISSLTIKFTSNLSGNGSNRNIAVLYSYGVPDTWVDVLNFAVHEGHTPDEDSATKSIAISTALLTGTDPLFVWILLSADANEDYTNTDNVGHFWDMEIYADGVSQDVTTQSWTTGNVAKLIVSGTTPTKYRNFTVERE